jgi:hypothetical protein
MIRTSPSTTLQSQRLGLPLSSALAQLAQQSVVDGERGAHGIKMLPPRHHGISFRASA